MWRSEDNLQASVLYHVGSVDNTQVLSPGGKHPYLLSHLTSPQLGLLAPVVHPDEGRPRKSCRRRLSKVNISESVPLSSLS